MCLILRPAEQAGEVRESSDGFSCAVVNGLEGIRYAVGDSSLVLNKTLAELQAMRGDTIRSDRNTQATMEGILKVSKEIKRMKKSILQFHSESQRHYGEFSRKLDDIHMGVAQLQANNML